MSDWLNADFLSSGWFLPIRIVLILIAAGVVRFIAHRVINKTVRGMVNRRAHSRHPVVPRMMVNNPAMRIVSRSTPFSNERREQRIGALGSLARSAVTIVLLLIVVLMIMSELGFNIAALLAGTSIVGIAVAFGVQTILRDIISGIFILFEDQLGMGDYVQIADVNGVVEDIGLRITQIRDDDGTVWYIRNGDIAKVANYSQGNGTGQPPEPDPEPQPEPDAGGR